MKKLLMLIFATLLLLSSCAAIPEKTTSAGIDDPVPDFTDEQGRLGVVVDGICRYRVIRGEYASEAVIAAARSVDTYLFHYLKTHIPVKNDFAPESEWEILVGVTNREETQTALRDLKADEYTVRRVGNKIVICGYTDSTTEKAVEWFVRSCIQPAETKNDEVPRLLLDLTESYNVRPGNTNDIFLPRDLTLISSGYENGARNFIWQADSDDAARTLASLREEGFELLEENETDGVLSYRLKKAYLSCEFSFDSARSRLNLSYKKGYLEN